MGKRDWKRRSHIVRRETSHCGGRPLRNAEMFRSYEIRSPKCGGEERGIPIVKRDFSEKARSNGSSAQNKKKKKKKN